MDNASQSSTSHENGLSRRAHWAGGETVATVLMAKTVENPEIISLAAGFVDNETLPREVVRQAMDVLFSDPERLRAALQYGTTSGYLPLRQELLARLLRADGLADGPATPTVQQVLVTAGSNQLLYLVGDTLLDPGDIVLCGSPAYFVYLGTLRNVGARIIGIETDEQGLVPEALEARLDALDRGGELDRVKLIYVTSYFDNPTGTTIPADRRAALVRIAKRWSLRQKIYVIDDVAYRDLRYYGDDVPSMLAFDDERDTVIVAGTFSKSFSPGLRIGWGVLPRELLEPVLSQKGNIDFGSPNFNQHLMYTVLEKGLFDAHLETLRTSYRKKLDATLEAAERFLGPLEGVEWISPRGGLYLWLRLPEYIDTSLSGPLFSQAAEHGVLYVPGDCCYPDEGPAACRNRLRLSYGIQSCESIRRGVEILAQAIRQVSR